MTKRHALRFLCVAGARPNYMKIKPVMDALEKRGQDVVLVHTGQHYDEAMSDVFFKELNLREPDHMLAVGSGTHATQTARVMVAIEPLIQELKPDVVVVVGDVNSTLAAALVGAKHGCFVAHVEAGLRSRDWSMPEEINRLVTDRVSDFLLAPSMDAVENLRAEGFREDQVSLVGNVMIDTLLTNLPRALRHGTHARLGISPHEYGLVTLHRPANVDASAHVAELVEGLNTIAERCPLVFPVHPRTRPALDKLKLHPDILLLPPVGYLDFIALQSQARLVMTDSGGVQEETTALGVPCLTLRDNTERPITVTHGTNRVVGTDPRNVVCAALSILESQPPPKRPALWDGKAGDRIATVLLSGCQERGRLRPTDVALLPSEVLEAG